MEEALKTIAQVFEYILNPYETLLKLVNWIMSFVPSICCILVLFYAVTESKKVSRVLILIIACYVLITAAFAFHLEALIVIVLIALVLIKFLGGGV